MAEAAIRQARQDSLQDVIAHYPEVPRLIIIKTDVQRRGVFYKRRWKCSTKRRTRIILSEYEKLA